MTQTAIPYFMFRGGSSRGPFFQRDHLPDEEQILSAVLVSALGSGHPLNIDGIGGGNAVTTKVAMLSRSDDAWADIDYLFAQVSVEDRLVDYKPTCGNMMIAVAPAAIEMGLVAVDNDVSEIRIRAVNTGARVVATIQTPNREVTYDGDTAIDGVPGTAAPVGLDFTGVEGSVTGKFLPTGNSLDIIDGIPVTCMDFSMPMVIARASDFNITGYESRDELDNNKELFKRIEKIRLAAAIKMGMGDCCQSVIPKFGLISRASAGGTINTRYFMPWATHPTLAVTGSHCFSACVLTPDTVAEGLLNPPADSPARLILEHPQGKMEVLMRFDSNKPSSAPESAGVIRTARKLASGELYVPSSVWSV